MGVRTIREEESLETVWSELVYTEARLAKDATAKDLAPQVAKLLARLAGVERAQREVWREEVQAQASVDAVDDALDELVEDFAAELLRAVHGDRKDARFTRYFAEAPNEIIRLALQSEVERVRSFPQSLAGEAEKALKAYGKSFAAILPKADAALSERRKAAATRADQRVREVVPLIEDINAARLSIYGVLTQRAAKDRLPRDWADGFFRRTVRAAKRKIPSSSAGDVPGERPGSDGGNPPPRPA